MTDRAGKVFSALIPVMLGLMLFAMLDMADPLQDSVNSIIEKTFVRLLTGRIAP